MKHIEKSITPFVFFVSVLLSGALPAFADSTVFGKPYEFTLSAGPGFLYGTSYEIEYKAPGSRTYLSELQWNIKPLLFLGLDLEFGPKNPREHWGLFAGLGLKAGLPMQTGRIEDRDWLEPAAVPGSLTLFSSHENHTKAAFLANIDTGFSLPLGNMVVKFYLNVDYWYFSWEARNGYIQYGPNGDSTLPYEPWDSGFEKDYDKTRGLGISYVQHWIIFTTGIGGEISLGRFTVSAGVFVGLPFCIAIDDHHKRTPPFRTTGILTRGLAIKPELGVSFWLSERFDLGLSAAYLYIGETRGNTRNEIDGTQYWTKDKEGARFTSFEGSVSLTYHL